MPPSNFCNVVVPAKAPSSPSPLIDLALFEFAANFKVDPRVQQIQEKAAVQTKIRGENKIRLNKAEKALKTEAPSPPSSPLDLALSEFAANIKVDSRVQEIQGKATIQAKIRGQNKIRLIKAAKGLKNTWKRDSRYRRWLKTKKQAFKALKAANDKLDELHREEKKIRAGID